jgi:hypothetical protein
MEHSVVYHIEVLDRSNGKWDWVLKEVCYSAEYANNLAWTKYYDNDVQIVKVTRAVEFKRILTYNWEN